MLVDGTDPAAAPRTRADREGGAVSRAAPPQARNLVVGNASALNQRRDRARTSPSQTRPFRGPRPGRPDTARSTSALVAVMDLPPSAAPRRRAPPQGRLCGRSPASSERRRGASLVAVPAGAPVSVARPRPRPKGTTAPGKPAPCGSRASPDRCAACSCTTRSRSRRATSRRPAENASDTRRRPAT